MNSIWKNYIGRDPSLYAKKILQEVGLVSPPITQDEILDYLGLELREFTTDDCPLPLRAGMSELLETACAWLRRGDKEKPTIWLYRDIPNTRKRLSVFHECGHAVIPWHESPEYQCGEDEAYLPAKKIIEAEAFKFGSELLLPGDLFFEDLLSLDTGIAAVEQLASRYDSSLEATAIRYANLHPNPCGFALIEPADKGMVHGETRNKALEQQMGIPLQADLTSPPTQKGDECPLRVKYFVRSKRFPTFMKAGAGIGRGSPFFEAWETGQRVRDQITASELGSSQRFHFQIDCLPLIRFNRVLAIIWLDCQEQKTLF